MRKTMYLLALAVICVVSCKQENLYDVSPSERIENSIEELRKELTGANNGWYVTYFPKIDSLLFTNPDENIGEFTHRGKYGYGGHTYTMRFDDKGIVQVLSDDDENSIKEKVNSEYEIKLNTLTQLSFTSYTYLHRLVNPNFEGSSDFLFMGKDREGKLYFKSPRHIDPSKEYIVFEKIKDEDDAEKMMEVSRQNRLFFQQMKNPQVIIRRGARVFYRSDMQTRTDDIQELVDKAAEKRYHLFLHAKQLYLQNKWPNKVSGLGSGYVGTYKGITFRTGIRYSKDYSFFDFERIGDKFVCELVKIYDHNEQREKWVSKHLYPNGEKTGVIAEIWDEQ